MFLFVLEFFFNLLLLGVLSLFSGLTWALCEGLLSSSAGFCFVFLWLYLCVCVLFKVSLLWLCYLKDTTLTRNVVTMYNVE